MLFRYTMLSEPKADSGHHTKGKQQYRWGRRRPHRYCCFPFVWCPESALGSLSIVYLNNMFAYCTYIYTQYMDVWLDFA